ncbi:MAG: excinuclease ABC subunit UvrA [Planctomycetota bacterium]
MSNPAGRKSKAARSAAIRVHGARMHNLRNLDLELPRDRLIVITGPSGSGKSSLAFDTIYAEGQRQYLETLSVHARQFLHQMERPEVELIEGLPPTICIDQRAGTSNPRSTVATVTEVYDFLRLLMARLGVASCYECGAPIRQRTPDQIQQRILRYPAGTKLMLLAPLVRGRKGDQQALLEKIRKAGFVRARVDGGVYDLEHVPPLSPKKNHTIEAVIDRIVVREGIESRIAESVRLALRHGDGTLIACYAAPNTATPDATLDAVTVANPVRSDASDGDASIWRDELFSTRYACPNCDISYEELEPRTFSFNSPYGACPECEGLGVIDQVAAPDKKKTKTNTKKKQVDESPEESTSEIAGFGARVTCTACQGSRLRPEANSVRLSDLTMHEITRQSIGQSRRWFDALSFTGDDRKVAEPLLREIRRRLAFLVQVGVDYLTLDRAADTLSGGELQRVRLATGIGSGLVGVCYELDEPSIGLHQRDNQRLIDALRDLQQQGNTVLVVEHDDAMMRQADWLVDMGPGAGSQGGSIVAQGSPAAVSAEPQSLTGRYLSGVESIPVPTERRRPQKTQAITIEGATANNLQSVTATFPLHLFVCVTGVSGSGKSSLVNETLAPALLQQLGLSAPQPGPHTSLRGVQQIDKVIQIDQTPLVRTPRSNPATYTGLFDEVRKLFAATREAKQRGFTASRFSFNAKGGRCESCQGQGVRRIEMNFLPDVYVTCEECGGARFNRATLAIRYRGHTIADVLNLSVADALQFFENVSGLVRVLESLRDVGLDYLHLGRSSTTLSGGEAQRIKLATELARVDTGNTFYLLDEPTTGLHFEDIRKLLLVLHRLVDKGNSVLVIEHNLDVIKCADWLIDLGPEGGQRGGQIMATGTPEELAAIPDNITGQFLRPLLAR